MKSGTLPSMILWGPPGVGKTTLARLIAKDSGRPFHALSAIHSGVKDVRSVLDSAKRDGMFAGKAVLFIDEIHRFSKSQQDSLLGAVEAGTVTLIGATTENPSFEVIPALRSRCQVYVLESLSEEVLLDLVNRALAQDESLSSKRVVLEETKALLRMGGGCATFVEHPGTRGRQHGTRCRGVLSITDEAVQARAQHLVNGLRQDGRGPLRRRERDDQEHPGKRPQRRGVLPGEDGGRRRTSNSSQGAW